MEVQELFLEKFSDPQMNHKTHDFGFKSEQLVAMLIICNHLQDAKELINLSEFTDN